MTRSTWSVSSAQRRSSDVRSSMPMMRASVPSSPGRVADDPRAIARHDRHAAQLARTRRQNAALVGSVLVERARCSGRGPRRAPGRSGVGVRRAALGARTIRLRVGPRADGRLVELVVVLVVRRASSPCADRPRTPRCAGVPSAPRRGEPASMSCHSCGNSGIVLAVVPMSSISTPATASPIRAPVVASRWSWCARHSAAVQRARDDADAVRAARAPRRRARAARRPEPRCGRSRGRGCDRCRRTCVGASAKAARADERRGRARPRQTGRGRRRRCRCRAVTVSAPPRRTARAPIEREDLGEHRAGLRRVRRPAGDRHAIPRRSSRRRGRARRWRGPARSRRPCARTDPAGTTHSPVRGPLDVHAAMRERLDRHVDVRHARQALAGVDEVQPDVEAGGREQQTRDELTRGARVDRRPRRRARGRARAR